MKTKKLDTLPVEFYKESDSIHSHRFVWVRYNSTGTKIVYSNYPRFSLGQIATPGDTSEIGIIYNATKQRKILDCSPLIYSPREKSINMFPNWSPDDKSIVYGSSELFYEGNNGDYWLCVLTKLD